MNSMPGKSTLGYKPGVTLEPGIRGGSSGGRSKLGAIISNNLAMMSNATKVF